MFKKLFGKSKKEKSAGLLAFICLQNSDPVDWGKVAEALRQAGIDCGVDPSDAVCSFTFGDQTVHAANMPMPIPTGEVDDQIPWSRYWDEGSSTEHETQVVLIGPVGLMAETSQVGRAITLTHPTRAWYVGNASHIIRPTSAVDFVEGEVSIFLWVNVVMTDNPVSGLDASTLGMEALGHQEFEIVGTSRGGAEAYELLLDLAAYVIEQGAILRDGQTFGRTEDERLRIEVGKSKLGKQGKVIRLVIP